MKEIIKQLKQIDTNLQKEPKSHKIELAHRLIIKSINLLDESTRNGSH